jgi:hypothetical protein
MKQTTITIGGLVLTKVGTEYVFEVGGIQGLRLQLHPGWKSDVATATVQFPKGCDRVQSAGSYRDAIVGALDEMRQGVDQQVRRANKNLADFNRQHAEILALIGEGQNENTESD